MWESFWNANNQQQKDSAPDFEWNLKNGSDERLKEFHLRISFCLHDCLKWLDHLSSEIFSSLELLSFSSLGGSEKQWLLSNVIELFMMCTMWTYQSVSLSPPPQSQWLWYFYFILHLNRRKFIGKIFEISIQFASLLLLRLRALLMALFWSRVALTKKRRKQKRKQFNFARRFDDKRRNYCSMKKSNPFSLTELMSSLLRFYALKRI